MAVDFKVKGSRTSEYRFLPKDIKIEGELNGRHDLPDIEWLIRDIVERGQIQPVAIRNDAGVPVLCAGFSRWRAVAEINKRKLTPVPLELRCTYIKCSEVDGFLAGISENRMRNSTTDADDAHNVYRCIQVFGMTEEQVAKLYFPVEMSEDLDAADPVVASDRKKALKWVRDKLSLVNLSPEAQRAMKEGRLKGSAALAFAKLSQDEQKQRLDKTPQGRIAAPAKPQKAVAQSGGLSKSQIVSDALNEWRAMNNGGLSDQEAIEELCAGWRNQRWADSELPNWKRAQQLMAVLVPVGTDS